jgi:glycosyltransferase involved in cell wall biosynthesis
VRYYFLFSHWLLQPIQNKTEQETASMLAESTIFLSFSEFEGCPLPPLEAALSGNYVIGYAGEGGNEYFSTPIFTKINCGDIQSFVAAIINKVNQLDSHEINFDHDCKDQLNQLKHTFSANSEKNDISTLAKKITHIIKK